LSDIIQTFSNSCEIIILGEFTYGACCIDDLACHQLGVHLLLHYEHNCLISITEFSVRVMYIFVDILVDIDCCIDIIHNNFNKESKLYKMESIQYNNSVYLIKRLLIKQGFTNIVIAQTKPKSSE
jgi:2-(3-amino-3-carboxypropyl)histidine synthase